MKKVGLFLNFLSSIALFAQVTKDPGDFTKVKIYDRISAELIPSSSNKVEITGSRAKDVIVANQNGELKLALPPQKLMQGEEIEAKIYYKELESVDGSEGTYISSQSALKAINLEVVTKEGAEIKLMLDVKNLKVKSVTGGTVRLSGNAENQEISIGTGGMVYAKELDTEKTDVNINAGGEAEVSASNFAKARTKAGGSITVYGNPKTVDQKSILGGSITVAD